MRHSQLLAQAPGTFEVSSQLEPATKGAELASHFWPLESLRPCGETLSSVFDTHHIVLAIFCVYLSMRLCCSGIHREQGERE